MINLHLTCNNDAVFAILKIIYNFNIKYASFTEYSLFKFLLFNQMYIISHLMMRNNVYFPLIIYQTSSLISLSRSREEKCEIIRRYTREAKN